MTSRSTMHVGTVRGRWLTATIVAALLLTGCAGGDDGAGDASTGEAAEGVGDVGEIAEDAQEQLDAAGIDSNSEDAYAEVVFQGETLRIPADESFGCFITEDGGSDGAVDFSGTDDAGNEIVVGWAGDTPDLSSLISLVRADGSEWGTDTGLDVTISGSTSAVVSGTVVAFDGSGDEAEIVVRPICN